MIEMGLFNREDSIAQSRDRAEQHETAADTLGIVFDVIGALQFAIGRTADAEGVEVVVSIDQILEKTKTSSILEALEVLGAGSHEVYTAYERHQLAAKTATEAADWLENNSTTETLVG